MTSIEISETRLPPVVERAGLILSRYDVMLCDVWGVLHDGNRAFRAAMHCLKEFRANGGTVILVSNAPVPAERVIEMLSGKAVPRHVYDAVVSSGDIALRHVAAQGYRKLYRIGPEDRDRRFFDGLPGPHAPIAEADALVCTGLVDDVVDTAETYRPVLEAALARRLPFVCANPDLVVDVGGRLYLCAGAIADLYEHMGGEVFWAGKPHPAAYATAVAAAEKIRGSTIPAARIIAIGDSVRTDLAAARGAGIAALFIASGIHRDEIMPDGRIDPARMIPLFANGAPTALATLPALAW